MQRLKHPSIPYISISPSQGERHVQASSFIGERVVVTEKMDGEISSFYSDGYYHPRSMTYSQHWSRDYAKSRAQAIALAMRPNEIFVFENMYATHTVEYDNLVDYLYLLYIIRGKNVLSYTETKKIADSNGFVTPKVLFIGTLRSVDQLRDLSEYREGYVIRRESAFPYRYLGMFSAKYVIENFVQSDIHWTNSEQKRNRIGHDQS